ncbi:MAG: 30S ribosomal protein S2 [Candidatus Sungbacteria bacterium]|nr:30S ribosomal protein S2 [Candidatus Sungbacteria bacterium]
MFYRKTQGFTLSEVEGLALFAGFCYDRAMSDTILESPALEQAEVVDAELEAMAKAGVHFGHAKTKNHPAMAPYIFGMRNTVSILDLVQTKARLQVALQHLHDVAAKGGIVLLVGTKPSARKLILDMAEQTRMPYFVERWIGGALTNFKVIAKRVEYMETLERERATGEDQKYTKREQLKKAEEANRLKKFFDGLRRLKRLPDAVFIVDVIQDSTAVREAKRMHIPVIGLVDTNSDPRDINFPIPANDDALPALRYMLGRIRTALEEGERQGEINRSNAAALAATEA